MTREMTIALYLLTSVFHKRLKRENRKASDCETVLLLAKCIKARTSSTPTLNEVVELTLLIASDTPWEAIQTVQP